MLANGISKESEFFEMLIQLRDLSKKLLVLKGKDDINVNQIDEFHNNLEVVVA